MPAPIVIRNLTPETKMGNESPKIATREDLRSGARGDSGAAVGATAPGVAGVIAESEVITISPLSGEVFGPGIATEFYLGSHNKTSGSNLVVTDADLGEIAEIDITPPRWVEGGMGGRPALRVNGPEGRSRINFTPSSELFLSAFVFIGAPITSFGSSYKLFWVADGPDGFGNDLYDLVLLTKQNTSLDRFGFAGNGSNGSVLETGNGWVQGNQWFHFSGWIKDNGDGEMGALCQIASPGAPIRRKTAPDTSGKRMLADSASSSISRLHVMGDSNANNGGDAVLTLIDHLTFSAGPNARARVEIGNSVSYDDCTELYPCTVRSWSSSIEAVVRHPSPDGNYLHIHGGDGQHVANGLGREIAA